MPRRLLAVTAALGVLLAAGCDSQTAGSGTTSQPVTTSSQAKSQSKTQSTATQATAQPNGQLKSQLLTVDDLPTGWSVDSSGKDSSEGAPECLRDLKDVMETDEHADAEFVKGDQFPSLSQGMGRFADKNAAVQAFTQGSALTDRCTDISFTSDGVKVTGTIGAMSLPPFGERSRAWRITLSAQGITLGMFVLMAQKGAEVQVLAYGNLGSPDVDEFTELAKRATDKMRG